MLQLDVVTIFPAMFDAVEQSKQRLSILEYSLSQTSLEQIFNNFASKQKFETGVARGVIVQK